jgi:Tfp pilus assembly protein FimV
MEPCKGTWIGKITLLIVMCACIPAQAGDAPANAARQETTPPLSQNQAGTWYTTQKGDSLISLARTRYKGSPLRLEVLRDAIAAANPELAQRKTSALRPGTKLVLPEHSWVMLQTMSPYLSAQELAQWLPSSDAVDTTPKRDWVRFP